MFTVCTCIHQHISNYTSSGTANCLHCVSQELGGVFQSGVFRVSIMPTQRSCGPYEAGSSTPQRAFHPAMKADIKDFAPTNTCSTMDASRSSVQGCGTSPELESAGAHEVSTARFWILSTTPCLNQLIFERLIRSIQITLACTTRQS